MLTIGSTRVLYSATMLSGTQLTISGEYIASSTTECYIKLSNIIKSLNPTVVLEWRESQTDLPPLSKDEDPLAAVPIYQVMSQSVVEPLQEVLTGEDIRDAVYTDLLTSTRSIHIQNVANSKRTKDGLLNAIWLAMQGEEMCGRMLQIDNMLREGKITYDGKMKAGEKTSKTPKKVPSKKPKSFVAMADLKRSGSNTDEPALKR